MNEKKLIGSEPITPKPNSGNELAIATARRPITETQHKFDFGIVKETEIDGIQMGVLSDGTPFLSGRGLARLCGLSNSVIVDIGNEWDENPQRPRVESIKNLLRQRGEPTNHPYMQVTHNGVDVYAYPDTVCLAVLEYYAFEAGPNIKDTAVSNFRVLAGAKLREFIYTQVGYDPQNLVPVVWKQFHDRVSLTYNAVPPGYFGIFKEIADMIVTLGQNGLHINESFVPDISVGKAWSEHWGANNLGEVYGPREKWEHNYPDYFPQATSNPQHPWCYPEVALGEFRRWMREHYIGDGKFTKYLDGKVKRGELPASFTQLALAAYEPSREN